MRVIAGTARGIRLCSVEGESTRPVLDRVKESLFSILQTRDRLEGARVLDLYAGCGSLGIEALSRGATEAVFVDHSRECIRTLRQNLTRARLTERVEVIVADVAAALARRIAPSRRFDLIFCDPPFAATRTGIASGLPAAGLAAKRLAPNGLLLLRHENGPDHPFLFGTLERTEVRRWGRNAVSFYARPQGESETSEGTA